MKNKYGNLKCEGCSSYNLKVTVGYDGADYESVDGEGSGFDWLVMIECNDCARCYPIIRLNDEFCCSHLAREGTYIYRDGDHPL